VAAIAERSAADRAIGRQLSARRPVLEHRQHQPLNLRVADQQAVHGLYASEAVRPGEAGLCDPNQAVVVAFEEGVEADPAAGSAGDHQDRDLTRRLRQIDRVAQRSRGRADDPGICGQGAQQPCGPRATVRRSDLHDARDRHSLAPTVVARKGRTEHQTAEAVGDEDHARVAVETRYQFVQPAAELRQRGVAARVVRHHDRPSGRPQPPRQRLEAVSGAIQPVQHHDQRAAGGAVLRQRLRSRPAALEAACRDPAVVAVEQPAMPGPDIALDPVGR